MVNAICWFTLLAALAMVLATVTMLKVVNPLVIIILVVSAICFVLGNLAIAHHNRAQTA